MPRRGKNETLTHLGPTGQARMVDVSRKTVTARQACASATVQMLADTLDLLLSGNLPKGDAVAAARLAGVLAAKRTAELIPLCHPLPLEWVDVQFQRVGPETLQVRCTAKTTARTGVEMEAMTGAAVAALVLYDMAKSADKAIVLGPIQLEHKHGGRSGRYVRRADRAEPPKSRTPRQTE